MSSQPLSAGASPLADELAAALDRMEHAPAPAPSPAQRAQLLAYLDLMNRWGKTYNLTAVRDPSDALRLHLLDSLAVRAPLWRHLGGQAGAVLDVGSGGGLPGVVLAATMPLLQVTCVDAVAKKTAFVRQVAAELKLPNLRAEHARVETLTGRNWNVITSRAFASLSDFVKLTQHILAPDGVWMAMKGKHPADEIAALPAGIEVFHVEQLLVPDLGAERCLIWMRKRAER